MSVMYCRNIYIIYNMLYIYINNKNYTCIPIRLMWKIKQIRFHSFYDYFKLHFETSLDRYNSELYIVLYIQRQFRVWYTQTVLEPLFQTQPKLKYAHFHELFQTFHLMSSLTTRLKILCWLILSRLVKH